MVDYRESPFGRVVEVGWPTGPRPTVVKSSVLTRVGISPTCVAVSADFGSYDRMSFTVWEYNQGWRDGATQDDIRNATFTGVTSGATFKLNDHVDTHRCTRGSDTRLYSKGTGYTGPGPPSHSAGTVYPNVADATFGTFGGDDYFFITFYINNISGADTDDESTWVSGEEFTVTWSE